MHGKVTVEGPSLVLKGQNATALVMILHELATNAATYGALSVAAGSLHVAWWLDETGSEDTLPWKESDGPPLGPPSRAGFGTQVLTSRVASEMTGAASMDYHRKGPTS